MKFRGHAIFLSLFLVPALCFSFGTEAYAHDYNGYTHDSALDSDARTVDADSEDDMKTLLLHAAKHFELIEEGVRDAAPADAFRVLLEKASESSVLAREARGEGVFNNGSDIYLVRVTTRDRKTVVSHGRHGGDLYALEYDTSKAPLDDLLAPEVPLLMTGNESPVCATYGDDSKRACAIKQTSAFSLSLTPAPVTYMVGFDHEKDSDYTLDDNCSDFTISPTAKQVEEAATVTEQEDLLKRYVKDFRRLVLEIIAEERMKMLQEQEADSTKMFFAGTGTAAALTIPGRLELASRFSERFTPCLVKEGDFNYGSIYLFVMDPAPGISLLNGLDPGLQGLSVSLTDPDPVENEIGGEVIKEPNVLTLFQKALTNDNTENVLGNLTDGSSAFVKYHWDDQTKDGDEVEDFLTKGQVPGTTIKESYLEVVEATQGQGSPVFYVIGSGIYLDDEMPMPPGGGTMAAADDDGCSIAAAGSTHESTLLNLLLTASVLFSAVFWRRRG